MAVIADDTHAIDPSTVKMVIKNGERKLTLYGDNLAPAMEMVFKDNGPRDEFYKRLVDSMGA